MQCRIKERGGVSGSIHEVRRCFVTPPKTLVATRSTRGTEATGSPPPLRHAVVDLTSPATLQRPLHRAATTPAYPRRRCTAPWMRYGLRAIFSPTESEFSHLIYTLVDPIDLTNRHIMHVFNSKERILSSVCIINIFILLAILSSPSNHNWSLHLRDSQFGSTSTW